MGSKLFITTPIFYANGSPHLGHLYTALIADATQRFYRIFNNASVIFSTGMDEHGLKIQQSASSQNMEPRALCDEVSKKFQSVFVQFNIQYTDFVRTSEKRHQTSVQHFFNSLYMKNFIYKKKYEGWYCVSDETFVTEKQLEEKKLDSGKTILVSRESGHVVEWNSEENYVFKLSNFKDDLLHWLNTDSVVVPNRFQEELKLWISSGLQDLSISRLRDRVHWGVPAPNDPQHTVYVWMDALINYLTVAGYPSNINWPPDVQIIGKDILKFHGIYWPALLMAADIGPPRKLLVHSHWKVDGIKMSKSLGNIINPLDLLNTFTPDSVRYSLLKSGGYDSDRSWNNDQAMHLVNSDLANTLGNLLNRSTASSLNPCQIIPKLDEVFLRNASDVCLTLLDSIKHLPSKVEYHFSRYEFSHGIEEVMVTARLANLFIEQEKPWELKNNSNRTQLDSILFIGMLAVRAAAICLQPIVPQYASDLLNVLNIYEEERSFSHLKIEDFDAIFTSSTLGPKIVPFKRIKLGS